MQTASASVTIARMVRQPICVFQHPSLQDAYIERDEGSIDAARYEVCSFGMMCGLSNAQQHAYDLKPQMCASASNEMCRSSELPVTSGSVHQASNIARIPVAQSWSICQSIYAAMQVQRQGSARDWPHPGIVVPNHAGQVAGEGVARQGSSGPYLWTMRFAGWT